MYYENRNVYVGFKCFIKFNNKEIYGPFTPTLASGSDNTMPSCHAEVNAIKQVVKLKGKDKLSKCTMYIIRWSYNKIDNNWSLQNCVPCEDCVSYIKKYNINKFVISTDDERNFIKVDYDYIKNNCKKSTGRLYGK